MKEYKDQVFELDRDLEDANLSVDNLGVSKSTLESEVDELKEERVKLARKIETMDEESSASLAANKEKLAGLESEIEGKLVEIAHYQSELTNIDPLVKRLRTAITTRAKSKVQRIKAGAKRRGGGIRERIRSIRKK